QLDAISLDISKAPDEELAAVARIQFARGSIVAWGAVSATCEPADTDALAERIARAIADSGTDHATAARLSWITPTCGIAREGADATAIFNRCEEVAEILRRKAG